MDPPPKRRRVHRHQLHYVQPTEPETILSDKDARILLKRSIAMALIAAGFDASAPDAMESFRLAVEEYILHKMTLLTQTMLASRRITTIPQDFAAVLAREGISLTDLLPDLQNPIAPPSISQQPLRSPSPPIQHEEEPSVSVILGPELNGDSEKDRYSFITGPFPSFPSKHTYKSTPDVKMVERDPRGVRERAAEEARLGEEALRRLLNAARGKGNAKRKRGGGSQREELEDIWRQTMEAVAKEEGDTLPPGFECGSVNYSRRYWMKPKKSRNEDSGQSINDGRQVEEDILLSQLLGGGILTDGAMGSALSLNTQSSGDGLGDATSTQTTKEKDFQPSGAKVDDVTSTQASGGGTDVKNARSNGDGVGDDTSTQTIEAGGNLQNTQTSSNGQGDVSSTQTTEGGVILKEKGIQSSGETVDDVRSTQTIEGGGEPKNTQSSGGEMDITNMPPRDEGGSFQTVQSSQANNDSGTVEASSTPGTSQTAEPSQTNKATPTIKDERRVDTCQKTLEVAEDM